MILFFIIRIKVYFGKNQIQHLPEELLKHGKKVLLSAVPLTSSIIYWTITTCPVTQPLI